MFNINDQILGFFLRHGTKEHHGRFFKSYFLTYEISGFQILRGLLDPSGLRLAART